MLKMSVEDALVDGYIMFTDLGNMILDVEKARLEAELGISHAGGSD